MDEYEKIANEKALAAAREEVKRNPDSAEAHSNLAAAHLRLHRYKEAYQAADKAIEIDANNALAHETRREADSKIGPYESTDDKMLFRFGITKGDERLVDRYHLRVWDEDNKIWKDIPDKKLSDYVYMANMLTDIEVEERFPGSTSSEAAIDLNPKNKDLHPPYSIRVTTIGEDKSETTMPEKYENRVDALKAAHDMALRSFKEFGSLTGWMKSGEYSSVYNSRGRGIYYLDIVDLVHLASANKLLPKKKEQPTAEPEPISGDELVSEAIEYATWAHVGQRRRGTRIPYICHPMDASKILAELGCRDELIAAAILHDVVEDTHVTVEDIRKQFNEEIAALVGFCTQPPKEVSSWRERKQSTLDMLANTESMDAFLVSAADKLANFRDIVKDYEEVGDTLWKRFHAPRDDILWYYSEMARIFSARFEGTKGMPLALEFEKLLDKLIDAVGGVKTLH